jgi:hypothetical protein
MNDLDMSLSDLRRDLRAHLAGLVAASSRRLFGAPPRRVHYVARGACRWCAQPFMRPLGYAKGAPHVGASYCTPSHRNKARQRRKNIEANAHLCPTPTKRSFITKAIALSEAANYGTKRQLRSYLCECRAWHLTSWVVKR